MVLGHRGWLASKRSKPAAHHRDSDLRLDRLSMRYWRSSPTPACYFNEDHPGLLTAEHAEAAKSREIRVYDEQGGCTVSKYHGIGFHRHPFPCAAPGPFAYPSSSASWKSSRSTDIKTSVQSSTVCGSALENGAWWEFSSSANAILPSPSMM